MIQDKVILKPKPRESAPPLREAVTRAALASGMAETIARVLIIGLSIATARSLQPREVGLLGLVALITGAISVVTACSETAAVTSSSWGTDSQYAFAATALRGLITTALVGLTLIGLGPLTRLLIGGEDAGGELAALTRFMLLLPVMEIAGAYPRVMLQRRLDLVWLALVNLIRALVHVGLSVVLLWQGYGPAGVVFSSLIAANLSGTALWLRLAMSRPARASVSPNLAVWREVWGNTIKVFAGGFLGYLNGRVDNLLVAGALGPAAMSFYSMAWNISRSVPQAMTQALGFALVPALSRIQAEPERIARLLRESLRHSYLLLTPLCLVLFISAPSLITIVIGERWLPVAPCLRVMCLTALLAPLIQVVNSLLVGAGRAHLTGVATGAHLVLLIVAMRPVAGLWGILGAAYVDLVAVAVMATALCLVARVTTHRGGHRGGHRVGHRVGWSFLSGLIVPFIAASISGLVATDMGEKFSHGLARLTVEGGLIAITYPVIVVALGEHRRLMELAHLLRRALRRQMGTPNVTMDAQT